MGAWLGFALLVGAQDRLDLWPEGKTPDFQPQQIAATTQEVRTPGFKAEEHTMPHLDWFEAPAEKNGACMLLIIFLPITKEYETTARTR